MDDSHEQGGDAPGDTPNVAGCACGCGAPVRPGRRYVSGHNPKPENHAWKRRCVGKKGKDE